MQNEIRRTLLKGMAMAGAGALSFSTSAESVMSKGGSHSLQGNVNHAVSRWTYGHLSIDQLCQLVKQLGFNAIDLVGPDDWPVLQQHGIQSSMCNGAEISLEEGWIHPHHHAELIARYRKHIELVAAAGYTNLVCFSGNANGMDEATGLQNAVRGLSQILPHAEKHNVVIHMELFNSKIDHPDYMADNSAWGIALCRALGSENFKLLYDIYHMQISEGDIIRTIRDHHPYFGHYHTAGVPGRHEIGANQELNYPAIVRAIVNTGFKGYLAQEFIPMPPTPTGKAASLREAIQLCDV